MSTLRPRVDSASGDPAWARLSEQDFIDASNERQDCGRAAGSPDAAPLETEAAVAAVGGVAGEQAARASRGIATNTAARRT